MVNAQDVKALDEGFADTPNALIDLYLALAQEQVSERVWGRTYDLGVKLLAAHFTQAALDSSGPAPVSSMTVGSTSVTYDTDSSGTADFGGTRWGQMYLQLRSGFAVGAFVV